MTSPIPSKIVCFVVITIILDTAGFGIIFPILPDLLKHLLHINISNAAKFAGILAFIYALMQFIFAPILGKISDIYGRRPVLLISLLGFSIDCFFMAFASSYWILFIGRIIAGITGATFAVASATIVDVTIEEDRTKYFGFLNAAFGLGFIIGPLIGGIMGEYSLKSPLILAGTIGLFNTTYGYFYFPETNTNGLTANNKLSFNLFNQLTELKNVGILLVIFFLLTLSSHSLESTWSFYTISKYQWDKNQIGISLTIIGLISLVVQTYLIKIITKTFTDRSIIIIGISISIIGLLVICFSITEFMLWLGIIIYLLGSVQQTGFQSLLSKVIKHEKQGVLQGILGSLNGLSTIIAPALYTYSFYYFSRSEATALFQGISFLIAALFCSIALILFSIKTRKKSIKKKKLNSGSQYERRN